MYPSDYGYAAGNTCVTATTLYDYYNGNCYQSDWLYISGVWQWLMMPSSYNQSDVFRLTSNGYVYVFYYADFSHSVRPTFYLKSDTNIKSGDGTSSNPYLLS